MQFVAAKAKIWWNNKGSSFFCNTVCTVSQKKSHLWLAMIFTYTVRLQQFLARMLPRK